MLELTGKTAFVTGGASGIGLAPGRAFAQAGMHVMLADVEEALLRGAVNDLRGIGPEVRGVVCDVADPDLPLSFHPAAVRAWANVTPFGAVSVPA